MLRARRLLLALSVVLWTAVPSFAQAPLTFDQAVAQALERSPALRAARARTARAGAEVAVALAARLPRVTFIETVHRANQPVFVFSSLLSSRRFGSANFAVDALNHPGALAFYRRAFELEQVLLDGGRTRAETRASRVQQESAGLALQEAAAGLVVALAEQYGRVLAAEARERAARAAAAAATEDLARAGRRRDAGRATDADVLAMAAHLADVRQREIHASGEAAAARAQINGLIGAPVATPLASVEPVLRPADGAALSVLVAAAESSRPEVARARAAEQVAELATTGARGEWWPRVLGRFGVESNGLSFGERSSGWAAGVDLQWSVSLGGAELARVRAAVAGLSEARALTDQARASAAADAIAARERQRSARARLEVGRAAVAQARESERIFRDRYQAGLASVNDLLRSAALVFEAETARVDALVDAFVADVQLDQATGRNPLANR